MAGPSYSPEEFTALLKATIQVSNRNAILSERVFRSEQEPINEEFNSEEFEMQAREKANEIRRKAEMMNSPETSERQKWVKLDQYSCFPWCIAKGKAMKHAISDREVTEFSKIFLENENNKSNTHEDYFHMARIKCHQEYYGQAIELLNKSILMTPENKQYKLWKDLISIKAYHEIPNLQSKSSICCGSRDNLSKADFLRKIIYKLYNLPRSIESMWGLMELSFNKAVVHGQDIEKGRFYASAIKNIDSYYGYLAWAYIYKREGNKEAIIILLELISSFPGRPEAYYMAWDYYFTNQSYESCKDIAAEAFLKVTDPDYNNYYIIFCLRLAKSYYYTGSFSNCIELLHRKYLEHPEFPIFLYSICKYSILSDEFSFLGVAKGTLRELKRLCDSSRLSSIYYWLSRAYLQSHHYPLAHRYSLKSLNHLNKKQKTKQAEMQKTFLEFKPNMEKIVKLQEAITQGPNENFLRKYEEIREFHKPTAEILHAEMLYRLGQKEEAINILKLLISTSRTETGAYFRLIEYDPKNTETILKNLLNKAKNSQIPAQVWVKASLLYSKFLFKSAHYHKAFYILRVLAKMLPPMPYFNIPYCESLKNAETFQELANAFSKVDKKKNLKPSIEVVDIRDLSNIIAEEAQISIAKISPRREKNVGGKAYKKFSSLAIDADLDEHNQRSLIGSPRNENHLMAFSVCSKPKFLYYIAKFAVLSGRNKPEGILAINDFKVLLSLYKNSMKADNLMIKALSVERELIKME